jgi:hypothetical protein
MPLETLTAKTQRAPRRATKNTLATLAVFASWRLNYQNGFARVKK